MNSQFNKKEPLSENTSFSAKFNNSPFEGPLVINELAGPFNTTLGLTHCPGRSSKHSKSNLWNRDLLEDFMEILSDHNLRFLNLKLKVFFCYL